MSGPSWACRLACMATLLWMYRESSLDPWLCFTVSSSKPCTGCINCQKELFSKIFLLITYRVKNLHSCPWEPMTFEVLCRIIYFSPSWPVTSCGVHMMVSTSGIWLKFEGWVWKAKGLIFGFLYVHVWEASSWTHPHWLLLFHVGD